MIFFFAKQKRYLRSALHYFRRQHPTFWKFQVMRLQNAIAPKKDKFAGAYSYSFFQTLDMITAYVSYTT